MVPSSHFIQTDSVVAFIFLQPTYFIFLFTSCLPNKLSCFFPAETLCFLHLFISFLSLFSLIHSFFFVPFLPTSVHLFSFTQFIHFFSFYFLFPFHFLLLLPLPFFSLKVLLFFSIFFFFLRPLFFFFSSLTIFSRSRSSLFLEIWVQLEFSRKPTALLRRECDKAVNTSTEKKNKAQHRVLSTKETSFRSLILLYHSDNFNDLIFYYWANLGY